MKSHLIWLVFWLSYMPFAMAVTPTVRQPQSSADDRRIRSMLYEPSEVFRIRGWVGYHIDLQFESDESFVTLGGGDLEALSYGSFKNHLVIKPKAAPIRTNLTVITTRRTYIFEYSVTEGAPDPGSNDLVFALRFSYGPPAPDGRLVTSEFKDSEQSRFQNLDYWFCGDVSLQPVATSDDGVHTRIRFSPRAEIPALFVRNDDGTESLLNYSVDMIQGDIIVHRTVRKMILRRGRLTACIVNRGYAGAGERLDSGTISPEVKRAVSGVHP